jgi:hypothetical protein
MMKPGATEDMTPQKGASSLRAVIEMMMVNG